MTTRALWTELVQVARNLSGRQEGPPVRGFFSIKSESDLRALKSCLEAEHDTHLTLVNAEEQTGLRIGQTVEITISPRLGFGLIKHDLDDMLIGSRRARIKEPSFLFIADGVSNDTPIDGDHVVSRYRVVLQLIETLKRSAAFLDADGPALVFIKNGKFELPIEYNTEALVNMPLQAVRDIVSILPANTHENQCIAILGEAVVSFTEGLAAEERFRHLLVNATEIKRRFEQGYHLFAAGFSYEKIKDQVEAARVDYIGKIHKVLSDIQNQLLGIPVATIIVATQMKDAKDVGYEFWVNTAVLVGCWVFASLMVFLLHNQSHTLGVLRDEIHRQERLLKKEYAAVASQVSNTFDYLAKRAITQGIILWVIDGFVIVGLLLSHVIYLKLTPPARDWAVSFLPILAQWF